MNDRRVVWTMRTHLGLRRILLILKLMKKPFKHDERCSKSDLDLILKSH